MPIYEYQCSDCSHRLEVLQKLSATPLTECPQCGHNTLSKMISAAGFHLKGTGWYKTDFRNPVSANSPVSPAAESAPNIDKTPKLT